MERKGEMGVGVMILFIAVLLVAAVAAGVLVTTVSSLQSKAVVTGSETLKEVTNKLSIVQITGENGTAGEIQNLSMIVRLSAGSDPINLTNTLLTVTGINDSSRLQYHPQADLFDYNEGKTYYRVRYEVNGSYHKDGFMVKGDIATVFAVLPHNVSVDEEVSVRFIPKYGSPSQATFRTPGFMGTLQVLLYP